MILEKEIEIRPLDLTTDLTGLIPLHLSINGEDSEEGVVNFYRNYDGNVWMAHLETTIVGFIALSKCLWNRISIVEEMAVGVVFQNRGIGKQLLNFVIQKAENRGDRFVTVQTATWNKRGIRFYERERFSQKTIFEQYFGDDTDMIWLERKL